MPSAKILESKKKIVNELSERFKNACSGVLVNYEGITVADDTALRAEMRKAGVKYTVIKNTLIKLAAEQAGLNGFEDKLNGSTAVATSEEDLVAPAKILSQYAEKNENFEIKAGFVEGKILNIEEIKELAKLPSKEVLIAKVLCGLNAPISGFANVLNANLRGLVVALNAIAEKQSA